MNRLSVYREMDQEWFREQDRQFYREMEQKWRREQNQMFFELQAEEGSGFEETKHLPRNAARSDFLVVLDEHLAGQ